MTPDEARALLDNSSGLLPFEAELAMEGAAKDMAAMIAADIIQYGVEYYPIASSPDWSESPVLCYLTEDMDFWVPEIEVAKEALEDFQDRNPDATYRIIARRVSPTWEVKEGA